MGNDAARTMLPAASQDAGVTLPRTEIKAEGNPLPAAGVEEETTDEGGVVL